MLEIPKMIEFNKVYAVTNRIHLVPEALAYSLQHNAFDVRTLLPFRRLPWALNEDHCQITCQPLCRCIRNPDIISLVRRPLYGHSCGWLLEQIEAVPDTQ